MAKWNSWSESLINEAAKPDKIFSTRKAAMASNPVKTHLMISDRDPDILRIPNRTCVCPYSNAGGTRDYDSIYQLVKTTTSQRCFHIIVAFL